MDWDKMTDLVNLLRDGVKAVDAELAKEAESERVGLIGGPAPEPTVTLHGVDTQNPYVFSNIEEICGLPPGQGTKVVGENGSVWSYVHVTESPAQITIAARKVWPDWSCPGAVPPMVVLQSRDLPDWKGRPVRYSVIKTCRWFELYKCTFVEGTNPQYPKRNDWSCEVLLTPDAIRAACAAAGVPCPPEEKPCVLLPSSGSGVDVPFHKVTHIEEALLAEGEDGSVAVILERQPSGEVCVVGIDEPNRSYDWTGTFHVADDPRVAKLQKRVVELEGVLEASANAFDVVQQERDEARKHATELERLLRKEA